MVTYYKFDFKEACGTSLHSLGKGVSYDRTMCEYPLTVTKKGGMRMKRRLFVISLVALLVMAFVIPVMAAGKKAYTLGAVFSVTGRASFLGDPEKKTTQMVVDQINAAGGINGHPLQVIIYDDKSDDTEGRLLVTRLIKTDKVTAVFGPSLSGISLAVVDLANKHKIPLVSCAASWKIVTNPTTKKERKWVFKVPQKDSHAVEKIYDFMKYKGITKSAIVPVPTGFGASGREELIRLAPYYGMTLVADEKFGPKDADMTAQLTRIGFPVFSYGAFPVGPKRAYPRGHDALTTARFGDFKLTNDDVIMGDDDGVVFALLQDVEEIIALARKIRATEQRQAENIKNGKTLFKQFKFDEYLKKRGKNPELTFREHLQQIGGAIEV